MHQTILPSMYIPFIKINTSHLNCSISTVLFWLLSFSLLRKPLPLLVFWGDSSNLLLFRSYNLGSFSTLQKNDILGQYFISELFQVLYLLSFVLFLHKLPFLSFLSYLSLGYLSSFLSSLLNIIDLCYLFQLDLELLLLFMPSLHLLLLLFKHISIVLRNFRRSGEKHDSRKERKFFSFLFIYYWLR